MTTILRMSKFGRGYTVALECGHKLHATAEDARRDQLFIGKMVACKDCATREGPDGITNFDGLIPGAGARRKKERVALRPGTDVLKAAKKAAREAGLSLDGFIERGLRLAIAESQWSCVWNRIMRNWIISAGVPWILMGAGCSVKIAYD
jgi:hypothetical protein